MIKPRDYYEVLGVARDASEAEIKKAFRGRARELHPDVNRHDPAAEEQFKELAGAHEVLSDPERRAIYDRYGHEGLRSGGFEPTFADLSDILETFFGAGDPFSSLFGGGGRGRARGADIAAQVELTLEEVARGASKDVEFESMVACSHCRGNGAEPGTPIVTCSRCGGTGQLQTASRTPFGQLLRAHVCDRCNGAGKIPEQPCTTCRGSGRKRERQVFTVDVPAGIEDGQRIRVSGRGQAGDRGAPSGDLYVLARVAADQRFERHGDELITRLDVPFTDAALGSRVAIPTLEGDEEAELSAGTQPGAVIRLRARGLPSLHGRRRGDLHAVVNVMVPRNLTDEQRSLLEQFAEAANGDNYSTDEERGSFFDRLRQAFRS
jgi:molecular chaperone DnaJ